MPPAQGGIQHWVPHVGADPKKTCTLLGHFERYGRRSNMPPAQGEIQILGQCTECTECTECTRCTKCTESMHSMQSLENTRAMFVIAGVSDIDSTTSRPLPPRGTEMLSTRPHVRSVSTVADCVSRCLAYPVHQLPLHRPTGLRAAVAKRKAPHK